MPLTILTVVGSDRFAKLALKITSQLGVKKEFLSGATLIDEADRRVLAISKLIELDYELPVSIQECIAKYCVWFDLSN